MSTLLPKISIDYIAKRKIMHFVHASNSEVSGLGKLIVKDTGIHVTDIMLLPQKNGATSTDIEAEDVCKAMFEMKDTPGDLKFWWHSHVDMDVFWSGTDMDTIKMLGSNGWFLNTVFNKRNETKTALYMKKPYEVFLDDLTLSESHNLDESMVAQWDSEYKINVTDHIPPKGNYPGHWVVDDATGVYTRVDLRGEKPLTKKQKRALKKARKNQIGVLDMTTPMVTHQDIMTGDSVISDDLNSSLACLLCGLRYTCECAADEVAMAEWLDDNGACCHCEELFEDCKCNINEEHKNNQPSWFNKPAAPKAGPASNNGSTCGVY